MTYLLHFKLLNKENEYKGFYDQEKFPNNRWIGAKRYILYQKGNNERKIAFEAAINKFSVDLMLHLLQNKIINQEKFNNFINELADTEEKTGIMIARHCLESLKSEEIVKWIEILKFLDDDRKKYVLRWQSSKEFVYKWEADDIDLVRHLLSSNRSNRFFSCDLVPNATQGYYSSGEESKVNFLLSLYDALEKIRERKSEEDSRNIILLLDEVDAYFHPQYQIELINELLGIISKVFEGFYVQIILTSNTPIVLSDIPAANITYLENRKVHEEQNSVESFGSNIHILMKNKFYINTSMGVFAKKKIDNVIRFLSDQDSLCKSKEEAKYIISVIGEPIIKEKLQQMYYYKFPEDIPNQNEKIKFYKKRVDELQKYILSSNINKEALEQLETELLNITDIIRKLRG
ncbi:ATP-binding protein [Blautia sp. SG-772]|nr:ATP-binding protein [Blautia sp. SG-772]